MAEYTVEKDIPMPDDRSLPPIADMEVGDSIIFPESKRRSLSTKASMLKKVEGKTYTIKKIDSENARVWRTA